jgi:LysM repeat protein
VHSPALEGIDGNITKAAEKMKKAEDAAKKLKEEAIKVAEVLVSKLKDSLDKANNSLDDAKGKFKDFKDAITGTITGIIDFSKAAEKENFLEGLVEQANNAKVFADKVKKLVQIGLSERAIQLVLDAGYEAGSLIADQIIAGGNSIVNQVNELVASVATVADQVGEAGADLFYGEGVRQAQSLVNGIQAELDRAQISLDNIKLSGAPGGGGGGTTTAGAPSSSTYVVKPGDSLSNIAKKNNTTLQDILNANPKFTDQAKYNGGSTIFSGTTVKIPRKAMGGLVSGRMPYIVGENGPELFMPNVNGSVTPNNESRNISGGVYNITINAGIGADGTIIGRQIVEAITKYERNSGAVFVRQ